MKIKICGIKTFEDALTVIEAGADMLGFNFYPASPRYITPGDCMSLIVRMETELREELADVNLVGVFVDAGADFIHGVFRDCHLDLIQLSGNEPPELLEALGERAFKALRPVSAGDLADALRRYPRRMAAPTWLVDAYSAGSFGGTGLSANWELARELARSAQIILAGGLRPDNVAEAIRQVNPWGVDVASGVESAPGVKDARKVRDFIRAVRSYQQEPSL